jgi:ubiquinone biosynthesis protein COQ4
MIDFAPPPVRPVQALLALARLIKDPQDTGQVSLMEIALSGKSQLQVFERFMATPAGQAVVRQKRSLAKTLDNHEFLRTLPETSLGRHYLEFVEQERLSAQGLRDATPATTAKLAEMPEAWRLFFDYTSRDMHDLYHVLCGYGRDELGEICVLAAGYEQLRLRSYKVIATIGPFVVSRKYLRRTGVGTTALRKAVSEARQTGQQAVWLPGVDIEAALSEDLDDLRARLRIPPPAAYDAVLARIKANSNWVSGAFSTVLAA